MSDATIEPNVRTHAPRGLWRQLAAFAGGQGASQGLSLVTGLLLLRWLSVEAYAQYSVAFAFQRVLSVLTDLGLQGSIVALVGSRASEPGVVARYLTAASQLRLRSFLLVASASAAAFPLLTARQPWPWSDKLLLWLAVLAFVWLEGGLLYGAPLLIAGRVGAYYAAKTIPAVARLMLSALAWSLGWLTGWLAAGIAALQTGLTSWGLRRAVERDLSPPGRVPPQTYREFWSYLGPLLPTTVYYAFQDQIVLGIVAWVGSSQAVAEVGALGRLAQIFLFLGAANPVLVAPRVASAPLTTLPRVYGRVLAASCLVAGSLAGLAWWVPEPFLWLLGPNYSGLADSVAWAVTAGALSLVAATAYTMNAARRWVFVSATSLSILATLSTQILMATTLDLSASSGAARFMAGTAASLFVGVGLAAWLGFRRDRSSTER
ncbi:MAG: hypothetical protein N2109_08150 [Fimbriimonadales bacterium]|nr:hypothetical protein [Fimbriimonadales bacterium]